MQGVDLLPSLLTAPPRQAGHLSQELAFHMQCSAGSTHNRAARKGEGGEGGGGSSGATRAGEGWWRRTRRVRCAVAVRSPPFLRPASMGSCTVKERPGAMVDSRTRSLPSSRGLSFTNGMCLGIAVMAPAQQPLHGLRRKLHFHNVVASARESKERPTSTTRQELRPTSCAGRTSDIISGKRCSRCTSSQASAT